MPPERELDRSQLRRIVDVLPRAIVVTDLRGTIRLWSDGAERLYGWTEAEVLDRPVFDILGGADPTLEGRSILDVLVAGGEHRSEREVVHRDGSTVHVYSITRALLGEDGSVEFVVGATDDLAEVAALERETQAISAHLNLALDAGGLGTWRWDLASGRTTWDPRMERLFGLEPGTFDGTFEAWRALLHPDDVAEVLAEVDRAVAARSSYRLEHRIVTPAGDVRWIEGAGRVTLDEDGEPTGTIGCCHDITERATAEQERARLAEVAVDALARERVNRERRDRTARTDAALAGLGRRLAASASVDQVLMVIAEDAAGVLAADQVEVGLARDAESLTMVADERIVPLSEAGPLAAALSQAEVILHLDGAWSPDRPTDEPVDGTLVASPLYDDVHHPMGVLVLRWAESTALDEVDLNAVETLSRLCGQSIVRAQLAGHTEELADLAASMAAARNTTEVAELLRDHGTRNLGATIANLRIIEAETATLVPVIPSATPDRLARRYERIPLDLALPLTDAVRDQEPLFIPDLDDYRARYPGPAEEAAAAGLGASAVLPLCDSESDPIGAVAFAWPAAMRFDHRLRSRLTTLSDLAAQTLERVRLFEAEHAVVTSMQRRLLTPLPEVDGVELAALYEPAAAAVGMGGDWYEAVRLDDGSVVVIMGDVVGHGVEAVAAMAQIQHLFTGLLRAGTPLGDVLALANTMISGEDPTFATALLLHVDPVAGRVGYSSAGHPWALVRSPDGAVRALDRNQHPMFGLVLTPSDLVYEEVAPGTVILAYTDGLVERRDEAIDRGIERLAGRLAECAAGDLSASLDQLVDEVRSADPDRRATTDDVAAVLIRMR